MLTGFRDAGAIQLSKRELGETYLLGVALILSGILAGMGVLHSHPVRPWILLAVVPIGGLVGLTYWLRFFPLAQTQVWRVAIYAAIGTGLVTLGIVGLQFLIQFLAVSRALTIMLIMVIAVSTGGGALVGIALEAHRTTEQLSVRNTVLQRILRHNLRNDMTVVLAHIEDVKSSVDESERAQLAKAEQKIHALINLVDNIREVNTSIDQDSDAVQPMDLVPEISDRVENLRQTHPAVTITTDLPDHAWVSAEDQFGLVIDNIVDSALRYINGPPTLHIDVAVENRDVILRITDIGQTIPEADLSVLEAGTEETLSHGRGVELWLVSWLTERSNGTIAISTDGSDRCITIRLKRARPQSPDDSDYPVRV